MCTLPFSPLDNSHLHSTSKAERILQKYTQNLARGVGMLYLSSVSDVRRTFRFKKGYSSAKTFRNKLPERFPAIVLTCEINQ